MSYQVSADPSRELSDHWDNPGWRNASGWEVHLHAIPQGVWDRVQDVGGAHEEHFGEVNGHVQVVVQEAGVLLRVQQLQQRAGRVALVPCARGNQSVSAAMAEHHLQECWGECELVAEILGSSTAASAVPCRDSPGT